MGGTMATAEIWNIGKAKFKQACGQDSTVSYKDKYKI
jgi:hypothetical protein